MVKRDENDENPRIHCDICDKPAPSGEEILKGFGLNNMGWHCSGGTYICPAHPHPEKTDRSKNPSLAETKVLK